MYLNILNIIKLPLIIFILGEIAENICQEFTLSSNGITCQLSPGLIGDYLLQSERKNGRAVYRSKNEITWRQKSGYSYLYSFNAEEYKNHKNYEIVQNYNGGWVVSFNQ